MPDATPGSPLPGGVAIVEIRTTFSCQERAADCARRLVDERLAACVQIDGPVTSIYRWQGVVETAQEFRCTCKTTATRAPSCVAALLSAHEYETPEVIVTAVHTSTAYAAWVRAEVESKSPDGNESDADRPA